jgi:pimeloyl-ACP methyl ester carboxylesterase
MTKVHGLFVETSDSRVHRSVGAEHVAAYLSNMGSIDSTSERFHHVTTAVILIHGSLRNPDDYLCCAAASIPDTLKSDNALLLAPWFLAPEDGMVNVTGSGLISPLRWTARGVDVEHTWRYGADALGTNVSSFDVIDRMVEILSYKLPLLESIVIVGHSAGGQFAQRWGLLSNTNFDNLDFHIRIVAANPKSYAYLDGRRWMQDGTFRQPNPAEAEHCVTYNKWQWGWDDGVDAPYKDRAIQEAGGIDAVVARYATRDVIYLSGEQDVIPNGHCEAIFQGPNRLTRSARYYSALRVIYGQPPVHHRRWVVPNVHHDHCLMFQSVEGQLALFSVDKDRKKEPSSNYTLRRRRHHDTLRFFTRTSFH